MHIKYLNERETLDIKCTLQSIDDWPHRAEKQGRNQELPTVPRPKTLYLSGQRIHSLIKKNKTKRRLSKPFHIYIYSGSNVIILVIKLDHQSTFLT